MVLLRQEADLALAFTDEQGLLLLSDLMLTRERLGVEGQGLLESCLFGCYGWFDIGDGLPRLNKITNLNCKGLQLTAGTGVLGEGSGLVKVSA